MSPAPVRASTQRSHFLSDLQWSQLLLDPDRAVLRTPAGVAVPRFGGRPALGVLATLLDVVASDPAMAAFPEDWMSTRDLALHAGDRVATGALVVEARLERAGRSGVVVTGTVLDGHGYDDPDDLVGLAAAIDADELPRLATGVITFARISRDAAPDMGDYNPGSWIGKVRHSNDVLPVDASVYDRMTVRHGSSPGTVDLDPTRYVLNAIGTITGGAQAALAEIAARAVRPDLVVTDLQLHFLATVRVGPLRTSVQVVADGAGRCVLDVRLVDAGSADRLVALSTVTLG